jgi:hypothetical protein
MTANRLSAVKVIASPQRALGLMTSVASTFTVDPVEYFRSGFEITGRRFDYLGILSVIVRDGGTRVPLQEGRTDLYIPLSYIPRLLWAEKPLFDTGQWVTDHFGSGPEIESSTGPSWMGELYFNFAWAGIVIGMGLIGIWFRFLQEYFLRIDATIPEMLAGIVTIIALVPSVGGDLLAPTNGVIFYVAPILLMHVLVRMFMPPPARPPPPL